MPKRRKGPGSQPNANIASGDTAPPKWMLSGPPMRTREELNEVKEWVAALYSDDAIQNIMKAARITGEVSANRLRECLVEWGCCYTERKDERHDNSSFAPDKAQLQQIASCADKLEIALANLSDVSAQLFWHPFQHVTRYSDPRNMDSHVTAFGLSIHKYECAGGAIEIRHLRPLQIEEAVHIIRRLAEDAAADLPKQSGGQPQSGARLSWISSAQRFWRHYFPTAFDQRSPAFEFCFQALRQLDGNVTAQQVASAIRAANKHSPANRQLVKARTRTPKS